MRDGTCQSSGRRRATAPVDGPPGETRSPAGVEPDTCERITLIEFLWEAATGEQPVIFVSRELLQ